MGTLYVAALGLVTLLFLTWLRSGEGELKPFKRRSTRRKRKMVRIPLTFDALGTAAKDLINYFLLAVVTFPISPLVYVWGILSPMRWKSYLLLGTGIALIWAGVSLPEPLLLLYAGSGLFLRIVIVVLGHVYIATSLWQFVNGVKYKDFFLEDQEHQNDFRTSIRDAWLSGRITQLMDRKLEEKDFRHFLRVSKREKKALFAQQVRHYVQRWDMCLDESITDERISQCIDAVWLASEDYALPEDEVDPWIKSVLSGYPSELQMALHQMQRTTWVTAVTRIFFGAPVTKYSQENRQTIVKLLLEHLHSMATAQYEKSIEINQAAHHSWERDGYQDFYDKLSDSEKELFFDTCCRYVMCCNELFVDRTVSDEEIQQCFDAVWRNWGEKIWWDQQCAEIVALLPKYASLQKAKAIQEVNRVDRATLIRGVYAVAFVYLAYLSTTTLLFGSQSWGPVVLVVLPKGASLPTPVPLATLPTVPATTAIPMDTATPTPTITPFSFATSLAAPISPTINISLRTTLWISCLIPIVSMVVLFSYLIWTDYQRRR